MRAFDRDLIRGGMASGHECRANRPNTWLLRPMLQREDSPCQPGAVHTWPIASFRCKAALRSLSERSEHQLVGKAGQFGRERPTADIMSQLPGLQRASLARHPLG